MAATPHARLGYERVEIWSAPFTAGPATLAPQKLMELPNSSTLPVRHGEGWYVAWLEPLGTDTNSPVRLVQLSTGKYVDLHPPTGHAFTEPVGVAGGEACRPACQTTWQMFPLLLDTACRQSAPMASSADDSTAERLDGKALGVHPSVLGHVGLHNGPFVGLRLSGGYYLPWGQAAPSSLMRHDGMLVVGFSIR